MKTLLILVIFTFSQIIPLLAQQTLKAPGDFLGYEIGTRFTPHHKVLAYFKYVATQSDKVKLTEYGASYEGRKLFYAVITAPGNHKNLEQIRLSNLSRTGLQNGTPDASQPAIVWLSYNIHGNEASSSEAALKTLYTLVNPDRSAIDQWMEETVVIIDPMLNPDGRDRYVHWYKQVRGAQPNANVEAREHQEPWPGGRTNHYLFDLNRDWAWQTQKETIQRTEAYNRWMPQIHVDFHEQGKDDHYYFAPAAQPFHRAISDWQRQFQTTIGKNHMKYFNREGWLYFTRDIFDLFYPSYGDTWPTFNGAVGMTYEQAGHSLGGLAVVTNDLDTLTLKERIEHHVTTGLSTIEITAQNRAEVLQKFTDYFRETIENGSGPYKSFVLSSQNDRDKMDRLLSYLDTQQIRYGHPQQTKSYTGFDYQRASKRKVTVQTDDIIISTKQPKGVLARVLFEPDPQLTDSLTYDITAWSIPYAYGLEAYALEESIGTRTQALQSVEEPVSNTLDADAYAYLAEWKTIDDVQFLAALLKNDYRIRFSEVPFTIEGKRYGRGTLIITRLGNDPFDQQFLEIADRYERRVTAVSGGFVQQGGDFGSESVHFLQKPEVAVLAGDHISPNRFGEIWHFFDQQISYPLNVINTDDFTSIPFQKFDVLILPAGNYEEIFKKNDFEEVTEWIENGGRLIALEQANHFLADHEGFHISDDSGEGKNSSDTLESNGRDRKFYGERRRDEISDFNAGAIFRVSMDNTHPLAFGYETTYFSLKLNSTRYAYLDKGWNVGVLKDNSLVSGFTGHKIRKKLENSLVFGVQEMDKGEVIYLIDNPLFRAFWQNGKLLFANAVFMTDL